MRPLQMATGPSARSTADHRAVGTTDHEDLLATLLAARDDDGGGASGMSDAEIRDQLLTFLFGGSETMANTLAWAVHLLAGHPDAERRLHAEVDSVLAGRDPAYQDIGQLPWTQRVITEAVRLYPTGWMFTRTTTKDTVLGGQAIPARTTVIYSPYLLHHRGDLFTEPKRFGPDRPQPARGAYIPFGAGARQCIGDAYALTGAVLTPAAIAARWRLIPAPGQPLRATVQTTLVPHPLPMRTALRSDARVQGPAVTPAALASRYQASIRTAERLIAKARTRPERPAVLAELVVEPDAMRTVGINGQPSNPGDPGQLAGAA
ncbi:cytochrome P450 [Streptomyces sp. NPDC001373]|uniref:cytochrome P450 n=1 Tax=Streptomyces sp. NPDC001373 TaxID=3364565 RepID=UPI0036BDF5CB